MRLTYQWTWKLPTSTWPCATARPHKMPAHAIRMFGEQLTPLVSPWLLKSQPKIKSAADFANFTLIEAGDAHTTPPGVADAGGAG